MTIDVVCDKLGKEMAPESGHQINLVSFRCGEIIVASYQCFVSALRRIGSMGRECCDSDCGATTKSDCLFVSNCSVSTSLLIRELVVEARVIQVKVKPNSRVSSFEQAEDGSWLAKLKSPPVDGKANEELIALLASHFRCRKADVTIKSGASGRMKLVRIEQG